MCDKMQVFTHFNISLHQELGQDDGLIHFSGKSISGVNLSLSQCSRP